MAPKKKVTGLIKLQIKAGAANPAPPDRAVNENGRGSRSR